MKKMFKVLMVVAVLGFTTSLAGIAQAHDGCWYPDYNGYYNNGYYCNFWHQDGTAAIFVPYNNNYYNNYYYNPCDTVNSLQSLNGQNLYPGNRLCLDRLNYQAADVVRNALRQAGIRADYNVVVMPTPIRIEICTTNQWNGTNTEVRIIHCR